MGGKSSLMLASSIALLSICSGAPRVRAQVTPPNNPPFFGGGAVAFDPEIGIVNSGAIMDAQVVVSEDRRYVTINARASQSRLIALNVFQTQAARLAGGGGGTGVGGASGGGTALGFVGGAGFLEYVDELADVNARLADASKAKPPSAPRSAAPPQSHVKTSPTEILKTDTTASGSFLRKEGMFLLPPKT